MRLVASLTTIPQRVKHLEMTVNSLLGQSVKFDCIYLNLPQRSSRHGIEYPDPSPEVMRAVTINRCAKDYGPITKLLPTLEVETDPDTFIFVCDCDVAYPPDTVRTLLRSARGMPRTALGYSGYIVGSWSQFMGLVRADDGAPKPCQVDYLQGTSGILYRRGMFDIAALQDYSGAPRGMFYMDDVWVGAHLARRGVPRTVIKGVLPRHDAKIARIGGLSTDLVLFAKTIMPCVLYGRRKGLFRTSQTARLGRTVGFFVALVLLLLVAIVMGGVSWGLWRGHSRRGGWSGRGHSGCGSARSSVPRAKVA